MKYVVMATAAAAVLALSMPVHAQTYPPAYQMDQMGPHYRMNPNMSPGSRPGMYREMMMDDGSSSDFPTHGPTDWSAEQLNRQVLMNNGGSATMMPPR